ncbi:hypothetical protein KC19_1G332100 [Ceratodon purpureus]|uniref:Uncharacterized protein n=1 Tax=Ceratodon purpureus TaxID=3225 RepID=A0A8T0JCB8_CERPU|nr:hypothetical protein KC19_1G332100 [Ceratodon purpureus]
MPAKDRLVVVDGGWHYSCYVLPQNFHSDRSMARGILSHISVTSKVRCMASASFVSNLPPIQDVKIAKALSGLLGHGWLKIEPQVRSAVESAISGGSDDSAGKETLIDAWKAAQAVESFGGLLVDMLLEINDLCGDTGENVGTIPNSTYEAVEAAHKKYMLYLSAFGGDEVYLRKKVETELGGMLLQIKQRLTGMDPKWAEISVLGTSGLAGSYIEKRRLPD